MVFLHPRIEHGDCDSAARIPLRPDRRRADLLHRRVRQRTRGSIVIDARHIRMSAQLGELFRIRQDREAGRQLERLISVSPALIADFVNCAGKYTSGDGPAHVVNPLTHHLTGKPRIARQDGFVL